MCAMQSNGSLTEESTSPDAIRNENRNCQNFAGNECDEHRTERHSTDVERHSIALEH